MLGNQNSAQGCEWRETKNLAAAWPGLPGPWGKGGNYGSAAVGGGVRLGRWASGQEITKSQGERPSGEKDGQTRRQDLVAVGEGEASVVATAGRTGGQQGRGLGRVKPAVSVDIWGRCPAGICCPLHLQHAWTPQFFRV